MTPSSGQSSPKELSNAVILACSLGGSIDPTKGGDTVVGATKGALGIKLFGYRAKENLLLESSSSSSALEKHYPRQASHKAGPQREVARRHPLVLLKRPSSSA